MKISLSAHIQNPWLGAGLSSGLLCLAWYVHPIFVFAGLVPLLVLSEQEKLSFVRLFLWAYLAFFLWNAGTTWWIFNASPGGLAFALLVNSGLMCIPFLLFVYLKRHLGAGYGYLAFVLNWLSFEYLHSRWDLAWSWLNLGNVFAFSPSWVQWYEYTGTLGGSLWILLVNLWLCKALTSNLPHNQRAFLVYALASWLLPLLSSLLIHYTYKEEGKQTSEIIIIQPNIEPYEEVFIDGKPSAAVERSRFFLEAASPLLSPETALLLLPETVFEHSFSQELIKGFLEIRTLKEGLKTSPKTSILLGASTYKVYENSAERSPSARYGEQIKKYYDACNSAVFLHPHADSGAVFYHKSVLVPGVEKIPFLSMMPFLADFSRAIGGSSGSLATQKETTLFEGRDKTLFVPLICYESVFGAHTAEFVKKGGEILCILTNDAWWDNTPGHRQHFHYARLRAIETRRAVARSANTGISGFINQRGDILQSTSFWTTAVLKASLPRNKRLTFYVRNGDYLGRIAAFLAIGLLLTAFVKSITGKKSGLLKRA